MGIIFDYQNMIENHRLQTSQVDLHSILQCETDSITFLKTSADVP